MMKESVGMKTHDVLISGLGPTGAVLAGLLGQRGIRVAVFDVLEDLYPLPRAVGLDHEAMRILQELGISNQLEGVIERYRPSEYLGMDGQLIKRLDTEPAPHRLGWEPNYVFNQPQLESVIRSRLENIPGVDVHKGAEVVGVTQTTDKVCINVMQPKECAPKTYTASYLVACDGGASPIRKSLGLELEDLGFDEPWLVVDAIVPKHVSDRLPQTQVQYCEAQRPCTFVYCTGNHRRWEIMLSDDEYRSGNFPDDMLWPILSRWVQPGDVHLWRRAAYRFHGLIAKTWKKDRVFLAGDAAHMTPPFMAQGMVQGLRDANNLAWKLAYVLGKQFPESLLETYEVERMPHVRETTMKAMGLGRLICERDPDMARQRDQKLREEQGGVIKTTFRQQMIPGLTAGLIQPGSAVAGSIFVQPCASHAGKDIFLDDLLSRDFVLFVDSTHPDFQPQKVISDFSGCPAQIVYIEPEKVLDSERAMLMASPLIARWMRENDAPIVLVRPDKYVFGCAKTMTEALQLVEAVRSQLNG